MQWALSFWFVLNLLTDGFSNHAQLERDKNHNNSICTEIRHMEPECKPQWCKKNPHVKECQ